MMWGCNNGWMMNGLGWGLSWFFSLIFWIIIIAVVVWAIKWIFHGGGSFGSKMGWSDDDSAMNILKERYAKGEINKEEFEAKKRDLMDK